MDPSTLEDILIFKFNTDLWSAQLVQMILLVEKDRNSFLFTPGSASTTLTTATIGGRGSVAVNIFQDIDEDNADEKNEADFDD